MEHTLPALSWAPDALAPVISAETIEYHYGKHHQTYVTNLNNLVKGTAFEELPLEEIVRTAEPGTGIYNNACQHWNHTMYWQSLKPGGAAPTGELAAAIDASFSSFAVFKEQFTASATTLFGSGWTWLVQDGDRLAIVNTSNGDTPARDGRNVLLVCDVWEHAYYIDHRNARPRYLEGFFTVADFGFALRRLRQPTAVAAQGV
jgi:superoxide dismutase, Fe-Mn family